MNGERKALDVVVFLDNTINLNLSVLFFPYFYKTYILSTHIILIHLYITTSTIVIDYWGNCRLLTLVCHIQADILKDMTKIVSKVISINETYLFIAVRKGLLVDIKKDDNERSPTFILVLLFPWKFLYKCFKFKISDLFLSLIQILNSNFVQGLFKPSQI